jgi:hypothetical protein
MRSAECLDRSVFIRELCPEDLKLEMDQLARADVVIAARYLGRGRRRLCASDG